jgi:NDP-sugar pyrophosphorylase family protein
LYSVGIILAAGQGTRMRPLTEHTPKPLLKIGDRTLLQRQINFIGKRVNSVGVSVGYKSDVVSQHAIAAGADFILDIENGGNASWLNFDFIRKMNAQIVVITSDNLMEVDSEGFMQP